MSRRNTRKNHTIAPKNASLKIISGKWKGRNIHFEEVRGLRPTANRIRETLFNWLQNDIPVYHCLDLFAGSGALGIEALSREAVSVCFVDSNPTACKNIQSNLSQFEGNNAEIVNMDAKNFLQTRELAKFHVIFVDPPYSLFELEDLIGAMEKNWAQTDEASPGNHKIFYEHEKALDKTLLPENWAVLKEKKAGGVHFYLIARSPA